MGEVATDRHRAAPFPNSGTTHLCHYWLPRRCKLIDWLIGRFATEVPEPSASLPTSPLTVSANRLTSQGCRSPEPPAALTISCLRHCRVTSRRPAAEGEREGCVSTRPAKLRQPGRRSNQPVRRPHRSPRIAACSPVTRERLAAGRWCPRSGAAIGDRPEEPRTRLCSFTRSRRAGDVAGAAASAISSGPVEGRHVLPGSWQALESLPWRLHRPLAAAAEALSRW